ncbi:tryptophan halogenase [Catenovulum agarivorans DS-2]|uniref:Tryptophan halogenase n=1 Tax=Catenovulum agarivorans DS-2 TaxID=1328313 RepID=W7QWL3_9ALTE|nr:tryptophan halogenase family protein [Catenovulum agarivorans]EWH09650.1 tryptophan halogenase [Catenovulum agarivorans DS-2]
MNSPISSVVIVGGGNAGWLTAAILASKLKSKCAESVSITLIESPNIKTIGVGEGTWPSMRRTLKSIGISESDFIVSCNATFKQGAKFVGWVTGAKNDSYYHPLMLADNAEQTDVLHAWHQHFEHIDFSKAFCVQDYTCDNGLAPKSITSPEYAAVTNYAYHLDAGLFTNFLKKHCIEKLGVKFVADDVIDVNSSINGAIDKVLTRNCGYITGDIFIDCTGFNRLLINKHYQIPFQSCKHVLAADSAIACQVPYPSTESPITSHTISTAQTAGWIWDIGLQNRRGTGHVFASDYLSDYDAEAQLTKYIKNTGGDVEKCTFKTIRFEPGHLSKFWHKNCLAIGLSAGFIEPLEASALLLIEMSANTLAEHFPANQAAMNLVADKFNQTFLYRWQRIIDFLKLHYILNQRDGQAFWQDIKQPQSIPDSLQANLNLWQHQYPCMHDFEQAIEVFPIDSYLYVLYGMGFKTQYPFKVSQLQSDLLSRQYAEIKSNFSQLERVLEPNRHLLEKIKRYGLQKI